MKREAGQVVQPQLLKRRKLLITQSNRTHQIHGIKKYGHKMGTGGVPGESRTKTLVAEPRGRLIDWVEEPRSPFAEP